MVQVVAFMGLTAKFEDGVHSMTTRCGCLNEPQIQVVVKDGKPIEAYCPCCNNRDWIVFIEMGQMFVWPAANVIS